MELRDDNQAELLSAEDEAVSSLVGSLRRVEAPANFERRVMSAIESRTNPPRPFAFTFLAYAIPALLVLLIATFFVFRSTRQQPADAPAMAQTEIQSAPLPTTGAIASPAPIDPTFTADSSRVPEPQTPTTLPKRQTAVRQTDVNSAPGGGSFDEGQKQTKTPLPQGITIPTSPNAPNPDEAITHVAIPVREILEQLGVKADRSDGWHVKSVTPNSSAARSGLQVGDVVLALGDQDISARDDFETGGSINALKVRRGGKVVVLPLKN